MLRALLSWIRSIYYLNSEPCESSFKQSGADGAEHFGQDPQADPEPDESDNDSAEEFGFEIGFFDIDQPSHQHHANGTGQPSGEHGVLGLEQPSCRCCKCLKFVNFYYSGPNPLSPGHPCPLLPMAPILGPAVMPSYHKGRVLGRRDFSSRISLQMIGLRGFWNAALNQDFTQQPGAAFVLSNRPTYWSQCFSIFMHFDAERDCWVLVSASAWKYQTEQDVRVLAIGPKLATDKGWTEVVPKFGLRWNQVAGAHMVSETQVDVQVRATSLLATIIPCATEMPFVVTLDSIKELAIIHEELDMHIFLDMCGILAKLPADDGTLAARLRSHEHLYRFEAWFMTLLGDTELIAKDVSKMISKKEGKLQPNAAEEDASTKRMLQHLEAKSAKAAAELIAEEEREAKKRVQSSKHLSKKKSKSGKVKRQQQRSKVPSALVADDASPGPESGNKVKDTLSDFEPLEVRLPVRLSGLHKDVSDPVSRLRYNFPMFDDELLSEYLMESDYDLERAVLALSKLEAVDGDVLEAVDIPRVPLRVRSGVPKRLIANVVARTDHPGMPLYCFIAMVSKSTESQKYRPGSIVRPIPEDRFRVLGDEKGHFWLKKNMVPQIGDIVEISFFEVDGDEYLESAHADSPHRNEDLLCITLRLRHRCLLEKNET